MAKVTIDTNLLVYAIDATDQDKHQTVHTLLHAINARRRFQMPFWDAML